MNYLSRSLEKSRLTRILNRALCEEGGMMTLEASITVPMFVAIMLMVNGLFIMFTGRQIVSHALIQSAKSLAFDPYSPQRVESVDNSLAVMFTDLYNFLDKDQKYATTKKWYEKDDISSTLKERFAAYLNYEPVKADKLLKEVRIKNGLSGMDFSESTCEDGVLTVKVSYTQDYVFNIFNLASSKETFSLKVKMFEYKK